MTEEDKAVLNFYKSTEGQTTEICPTSYSKTSAGCLNKVFVLKQLRYEILTINVLKQQLSVGKTNSQCSETTAACQKDEQPMF